MSSIPHPSANPDDSRSDSAGTRRRFSIDPMGWASCAAAAAIFHLAYASRSGWLIAAFPLALIPALSRLSPRQGFYVGLALGFALYAAPLGFFWSIFGPPAIVLWGILALWIGLFLSLGCALRHRLPPVAWAISIPVLWTGLEYFRCELYPLRFTWLTPGFALRPDQSSSAGAALHLLGVHGLSMATFGAAVLFWHGGRITRWLGPGLTLLLPWVAGSLRPFDPSTTSEATVVTIAGAQIESAQEPEIPAILDAAVARFPDAQLLVLPEYSLAEEPPDAVRDGCRRHHRHLVVGGREPLDSERFRNTAYVVGPGGETEFKQAKSVPIQFFADGLPADQQGLWRSPWGRLGIAVCYDLSYTRVMDRLVTLGAQALIIPTMDVHAWGARQHDLHARVAPVRAAEYGLPIVRLASSGISQWVDAQGRVTASAPYSDQLEWIAGPVAIAGTGHRPLDRWAAPACTVLTGMLALGMVFPRGRTPRPTAGAEPPPPTPLPSSPASLSPGPPTPPSAPTVASPATPPSQPS